MNKDLEKKIESLLRQKEKKLQQIQLLQQDIESYDEQLKPLYDLKKTEQKIEKMKKDLENKIKDALS